MPESAATISSRPGGLPSWLVGVVVALVLVGAGWYIYRQVWKEDPSKNTDVVAIAPTTPPGRGFFGSRGNNSSADGDGVSRRFSGSITARKGDAFVRAMPKSAGGYSLTLDWVPSAREQWVGKEKWDLSQLGTRATTISRLGGHIGLSREQRHRLIEASIDIELTATEQARFENLFQQWERARPEDKAGLEQDLVASVAAADAAHLAAAKAATISRCQRIPDILTAQQIARARQYNVMPSAPTTNPAAKPANMPAP